MHRDSPHPQLRLFGHLNGLVLAPVAQVLMERGVLALLADCKERSLGAMARSTGANEGYLNVALRCLASAGHLQYRVDHRRDEVFCRASPVAVGAFALLDHYTPLVRYLRLSLESREFFSQENLEQLLVLCDRYQDGWLSRASGSPEQPAFAQELLLHVEGLLVGPLLVHLGMRGAIGPDGTVDLALPCLFRQPGHGARIREFLCALGWLDPRAPLSQPTAEGRYFISRVGAYGVPVSYLPMLLRLPELVFGDAGALRRSAESADERHVDRRMNVWGSGRTHGSYFAAMEDVVVELFNQPIESQPAGVLDMGCGDGALLTRLWRAIVGRSRRGKMLQSHPLLLFGVDYNNAALEVSRANLERAGVPAKLLWGDVGRPDLLDRDLREQGQALSGLLNVRTFLDHNRPWKPPASMSSVPGLSTGAYAHIGRRLANRDVEESLREHLAAWAPYLGLHGLLVVELHTIPPELAARHAGQTLAPAYDATHGFSDQYILELEIFQQVAARAGLRADPRMQRRFPDTPLATISMNRFLADPAAGSRLATTEAPAAAPRC